MPKLADGTRPMLFNRLGDLDGIRSKVDPDMLALLVVETETGRKSRQNVDVIVAQGIRENKDFVHQVARAGGRSDVADVVRSEAHVNSRGQHLQYASNGIVGGRRDRP